MIKGSAETVAFNFIKILEILIYLEIIISICLKHHKEAENGEIIMNEQTYQQPPPPQIQPQYQQPTTNIYDHFVGVGKLGLFLLLSAGLLALGVIMLDMCFSGILSGDISALIFIGEILTDLGIIAILTLLTIAGVTRTDLPENTSSTMLKAAGFGLGLYIMSWAVRIMFG